MMASFQRALRLSVLVLPALAGAWPAGPATAAEPKGVVPLSAFPREPIAVETRSARRHVFDAWRAESTPMRAQGLMFVREIREDQAMIFVYEPPQVVSMWMANTLIPLDMLFVDSAGCIVKVHENARPGSLDSITAGVPVALVVELKGGAARARGIEAGDRVTRPERDWPREARPCTRER